MYMYLRHSLLARDQLVCFTFKTQKFWKGIYVRLWRMHLCDPNPSSCMWKGMAVACFFSGNSGFLLHQWTPRNNMRANEISCSLCLQIVVHQLFLKSLNTNTSNINIPLHMACSFHYEMIQYLSILIITNWPFLRLCIKKISR